MDMAMSGQAKIIIKDSSKGWQIVTAHEPEYRSQESGARNRNWDARENIIDQKAEFRRQNLEDRIQNTEYRIQNSGDRR